MASMVKIEGAKELALALESFPPKLERRVVPPAVTKVNRILVKEIKRVLLTRINKQRSRKFSKDKTVRAKSLYRAITQRVRRYAESGMIVGVVGGKWPQGAHAHLVELGHRIVIPAGDGRKVDTKKKTRALHFQRDALNNVKEMMGRVFIEEATRRFDREIAKQAKKK